MKISALFARSPLLVAAGALVLGGNVARVSNGSSSGTAPFIFDDNRIFVELAFVRPDGTLRKAFAFVDPGTPTMALRETLRDELQIGQDRRLVFRVGDIEIRVDASNVETTKGSFMTGRDGRATVPVEAVLPGSVMKNFQVVFDYAKRSLTLALPGTLQPRGMIVPCHVNERTGLVSVAAVIGGQSFAVAVDSGSAYSWVRSEIARRWTGDYPDWRRGTGAVGEANMQTRPGSAEARGTILRLPEIQLGTLKLREIGVLGIAPGAPPFPPVPGETAVQGDLFDWYSRKAPEPVIGWLGGNVLQGFRVTIDYQRHTIWWEAQRALDPHDLDQVGITLETRDGEHGYFIAGLAEKNGKPTVEGVRPGDKLIQVDDIGLTGATRGAVFSALHGKPGTVRVLILEREGTRVTVAPRSPHSEQISHFHI